MREKKRCEFCLKIKPDNIQPEQKVLHKDVKDVLVQIANVQVASELLSTILICFDCAIALIQAEPIVVKTRSVLTRLSKHKSKKKLPAANGEVSTSLDLQHVADDSMKKEPPKIVRRRKSVSKKLIDFIASDELEGNPAASSTMAVNASIGENKPTPKTTAKSQTKSKFIANDDVNEATPSPKKSAKRKISEKLVDSQNKKATQTSIKVDTVSSEEDTKRTISERSDYNLQEKTHSKSVMPFKKIKDPDEKKLSVSSLTEPNSVEKVLKCYECGKPFFDLERYESHCLRQRCKLAAHACKHPRCMRRFFKLQNMLEHMQRKHPQMQDNEMDY